ncbi:hypothetical protein Scep_022785 [Stephania cephalantha]|uniref:Serine/threonine-protein kinase 11-interacting protein n=1 Tax=Stephania cephalantha TaxID=152367 RepID=A0AAP0F736_9MAGN
MIGVRGNPSEDRQNMAIVTGDRYLEFLVKFVEKQAGPLIEGALVLKLNPVGLHYVQSRLEALQELEGLLAGAPVDYLRAYVSDLGDHRALEQVRRILRLLTSLKVVSVLPPPARDPTPLSLLPFGRLRVLELRGCDLSTSAAKGLLELRHTLEKIICFNSTDALRHVFASRIVDIKDSPAWNRLSFVSCACNDLVLMDESLQLLPNVETLDISRNKFAKVDNLRRCTKLRHLDLGFNHLQSISSLTEVGCPIVKLVLRNNALTTLRGIENLKSLEGLDLSYNVISSFSELYILATLPSLQSLWLEGNPICCSRWYRPQVFSLFTYPEKLKLDEKEITTEEFWKRQIILASRQKRPAGFGFYSPATDNSEEEGNCNNKKKRLSRLAMIEDEESERLTVLEAAEQESPSCESDIRSREENIISEGEAEIVGLMNRIELMKKERSDLWLREFKDWIGNPSKELEDGGKFAELSGPDEENNINGSTWNRHPGESSRFTSEDDSSLNILDSNNSFAEAFTSLNGYQHFNSISEANYGPSMVDSSSNSVSLLKVGETDRRLEKLEPHTFEGIKHVPEVRNTELPSTFSLQGGDITNIKLSTPAEVIDEIMESRSSSTFPGSPPQYKEDILHRRHNLEEEFLQLSVESYSLASSDSDTSSSDGDSHEFDSSMPKVHQALSYQSSKVIMDGQLKLALWGNGTDKKQEMLERSQNGGVLIDSFSDQNSKIVEPTNPNYDDEFCTHFVMSDVDCDIDNTISREIECFEKKKGKRKSKRRMVALCKETSREDSMQPLSQRPNGSAKVSTADMDLNDVVRISVRNCDDSLSLPKATSHFVNEEFIKNCFLNVADSSVSETCLHYMVCSSILLKELGYGENEVEIATLLSSEDKLYVLLLNAISDGSGSSVKIIGSHRLEEINEVVFGLNLHVLRMHVGKDTTYLFITRNMEKSQQLIDLFGICGLSCGRCSIKSLEQAQVENFEKNVCGGSKMNIYFYSMVLFWCNNGEEEAWLSRSLFLIEGYILLCIEDIVQFRYLALDGASSVPYFGLDSCCSISNLSEMVIEPRESPCLTLTMDRVASKKFCDTTVDIEKETMEIPPKKMDFGYYKWKLKWFSEDMLLKFVTLLKALHAETAKSPLPVRYVS